MDGNQLLLRGPTWGNVSAVGRWIVSEGQGRRGSWTRALMSGSNLGVLVVWKYSTFPTRSAEDAFPPTYHLLLSTYQSPTAQHACVISAPFRRPAATKHHQLSLLNLDDLAREYAVFVASTAGQGDFPNNARTLWKTVSSLLQLKGKTARQVKVRRLCYGGQPLLT